MAVYKLPDGRYLEVDDNASREELISINNQLAELYPDYYQPFKEEVERTFGGNLLEVAKGVPRGLAQGFLSMGEGAVNLFDAGNDSELGNQLREWQQNLNDNAYIGIGEGYEDAFSSKLGGGLGSFASFFIPGGIAGKVAGYTGKGLSAADKVSRAQRASMYTAGSLGVTAGIAEQGRNIEFAREQGEDVSLAQEITAELFGGAIGASEVLSLQHLFRYIPKGAGEILKIPQRIGGALQTGTAEALQEAVAGLAQDAVARGIYSDEIPIGESFMDDLTVGGAVGFLADLVLRGPMHDHGAGADYMREEENIVRKEREKQRFNARKDFQKYEDDGSKVRDIALDPQPIPEIVGPQQETLPESTLEFKDPPVMEEFEIITNPDGTSSIIGMNTAIDYGVFPDPESAAKAAVELRKNKRAEFIDFATKEILSINGLYGNGTAYSLGTKLYDPRYNLIPVQAVGALDSTINTKRKEKLAKIDPIKEELAEKVYQLEMSRRLNLTFDRNYDGEIPPSLSIDQARKLTVRELKDMYDSHIITQPSPDKKRKLEDLTAAQFKKEKKYITDRLNNNETALDRNRRELEKIGNKYRDEAGIVDPAKFKTKTEWNKYTALLNKRRKIEKSRDELIKEDYDIFAIDLDNLLLKSETGYYPIRGQKIDSSSIVGQVHAKAGKKGIAKKSYYTPQEAKRLLSKADFNALMAEKANIIFRDSVLLGEIIAAKRSRERQTVTKESFNKVFESKNIIVDYNSSAFKYLVESITGAKTFGGMNYGQKELLMTRIKQLPRFDVATKLPDYTPRPYSANTLNTLYTDNKGQTLTEKDLKAKIKDITGESLSPKQFKLFKEDLLNSGRADKIKNRLVISQDFETRQAKRAQSLNESSEEFAQRLRESTPLTEEEILGVVGKDNINQSDSISSDEILMLPPPDSLKKYSFLYDAARKRLNEAGLKDIALKLDKSLKLATNVRIVDGEAVISENVTDEAAYDPAMRKILLNMTRIDPDGRLSDQELIGQIQGLIDHETIHALRDLDLLTDKEYKNLLNFAKKKLPPEEIQRINSVYGQDPSYTEIDVQEEYVAQLFRFYRADPSFVKGKPKTIIQKIINFFKGFFDAIFGSGFRSPISVLNDIESGKIGRRDRDKIRSLKELERLQELGFPVASLTTKFSKGDIQKELDNAQSRLIALESEMYQEAGSMSANNQKRLSARILQASNDVAALEEQLKAASVPSDRASPEFIAKIRKKYGLEPKLSRAGIVPKNIIFPGELERSLADEFIANNRNLTGKDIQTVLNASGSRRKHNWTDYSSLKADVRRAVKDGRDFLWYDRWGAGIPNIVGSSNMNEFSMIFGITSAQSKPEQNLKDTLRAMIVARKIDPVEQPKKYIAELKKFKVAMNNNARLNDIAKIYKTGLFNRQGTGQKTSTYALEILEAANNRFTPFSVVDVHMLRKFGLNLEAANEKEYRTIQTLIGLLATENFNVGGVSRQFTTREIQALLWADQRHYGPTKITNEGSYNSSVRASQKEIAELNEMQDTGSFSKDRPFSGVFIHAPTYRSDTKTNVFDTGLKTDMYQSIVNAAPTLITEMKMGTTRGYLPTSFAKEIPFATFLDYQNKTLKSVMAGTQIRFLRELSIPHEATISAGTYDGDLNPNILLKMPGAEQSTVRAVGQLLTDAFMQDASVTVRPVARGIKKTGLLIEKIDGGRFSVPELQELNNNLSQLKKAGDDVNFTLMPTDRSGLVLIDPLSFVSDTYTANDLRSFTQLVLPIIQAKGYNLKRYGQESEYIEYGEQSSYSPGTKSGIRGLGDRGSLLESSDLSRAALRDLYLPAYENYRQFAKEIGFEPNNVPPYLQPNSALAGEVDLTDADIAEVQSEARQRAEMLARGRIPLYNPNASPVALKIAFDMEAGVDMDIPPIPAKFHRSQAKVPKGYEELVDEFGGINQPNESMVDTILNTVEMGGTITKWLDAGKTAYIDKLNQVEIASLKAGDKSQIARELNNLAETNGVSGLRMSERARGVFAAMLKGGIPVFAPVETEVLKRAGYSQETIDFIQNSDLTYGGVMVDQFEHGGLLQIIAPLFSDPNVNLEALYKVYSIGQRAERLNREGKEVPVNEELRAKAAKIATDFKVVKQVYDKFQAYNNKIIDFAVQGGILSEEVTATQLRERIVQFVQEQTQANKNFEFRYNASELVSPRTSRDRLLEIANDYAIDTRGTAQIWKDNSDYYPFYRKMENEKVAGPNVASGFIAGNPLNIDLKGSEASIDVPPLEAIARNQLAIVTAVMKNVGLQRLVTQFEEAAMAVRISPDQATGADVLPVFMNGQKVFYRVADPLMINGLQAMGMNEMGFISKLLAMPAGFLRETVTRDPGFIMVNMLRDTLSTAVTSGANFTPFVDTFKNFNADLTDLERFGVIGGYDYSADPQNVPKYIVKELRKMGVGDNGSLSATDAVVKLWDFLGAQTTKSDGATRKAVADKVFEMTGSQSEAAFQALEVINFGRRGADPLFRTITSAIPFLNARLQGLDVLGRAHLGRYSAVRKQALGETRGDMTKAIMLGTLLRGGFLALLTGIYYALVSDDEEYKNARRETRDDNWIIPFAEGVPALKIPIPFEVGVMYKVLPERAIDLAFGDETIGETMKTLRRQASVTFKVDPLGFQAIKPLYEVLNNKSTYTGEAIVPYYMQEGLEPALQSRYSTNEFARVIGEAIGVSPIKLEYLMRGYGGTIGTYLLSLTDTLVRTQTDRDIIMPRIENAPFFRRFIQTEMGGGLQQQFYELREESNRYIQTVNKLKKDGRIDDLRAYMQNNAGVARTRPQILALDRYMSNWRTRRDRVLNSKTITPQQKKEILEQMEVERDIRLAYMPELREQASFSIQP